MLAKRVTAAGIVVAAVVTAVASASSGQLFAGFPAVGVKASTPTTGSLLLSLTFPGQQTTERNVYADGRIIWQRWTPSGDATVVPKGAKSRDTGYVQQRLTPRGVQLLRTKMVATGLFEHSLRLAVGRGNGWVVVEVRRGKRMVRVDAVPSPDQSWKPRFIRATPAQQRALMLTEKLVADPARSLPADAWADGQIRPFVPSHYVLAFDRGYPDLSKLPRSVGTVLSEFRQLRRHACQIVTTGQARDLLQALTDAGIAPSDNHAWWIGFGFAGLGFSHPSYLHLSPALPDVQC
jgi:hypothetical protein